MERIVISLFLIFNFMISTASAEFFIIVNKSNPVSEIGVKELRDIYMIKIDIWPGGDVILPVNLHRDTAVRIEFSKNILGKSPHNIEKLYFKRALSGQGQSPTTVMTKQEVINFVSINKGAIGYVSKADASVKVIDVK